MCLVRGCVEEGRHVVSHNVEENSHEWYDNLPVRERLRVCDIRMQNERD